MMIENIISDLFSNVKRIEKNSNRQSSRFVGQDMYPQVGTGGNWHSQIVGGDLFYHVGDIWLSAQRFKVVSSEWQKILTLSSCILVESVYIDIDSFTLKLGDLTLDIKDKKGYYVDVQRILYPGDGYEVVSDKNFTIELNYRELL